MPREHDAEGRKAIERETLETPDGAPCERALEIRRAVDRLDRKHHKRDENPGREEHDRSGEPVLAKELRALDGQGGKEPRELCGIRVLKDRHRGDKAEEQGKDRARRRAAVDKELHRPEVSARGLRARGIGEHIRQRQDIIKHQHGRHAEPEGPIPRKAAAKQAHFRAGCS